MSAAATLHLFAFGEHLDGLAQRSLGYRLLAPARTEAWCGEVEALARRLQATPYPDHWPPTDLFCSVLLAEGSRLVAVARYGLVDHTPSSRRGGLELIGTIGPGSLSVEQSLAIYHWLRQRRATTADLHALGGEAALATIVAAARPQPAPADPVPVLPVRLWQEGALLFAAAAPSDPDHRLTMLEQGAGGKWQWLPLVGSDFPLQTYAQRGPLIAWTPHLAGVALKLDRKSPDATSAGSRKRHWAPVAMAAAVLVLAALMAANLWATLHASRRSESALDLAPANSRQENPQPSEKGQSPPASNADQVRQAFADALYDLLAQRGSPSELDSIRDHLLVRYDRAVRDQPELRLPEGDVKGRTAIGAVALLSDRSARRIEEAIRKALTNRGYDAELVNVACQRIREQLIEEAKKGS